MNWRGFWRRWREATGCASSTGARSQRTDRESSRLAEDGARLSLQTRQMADLMRESDYFAGTWTLQWSGVSHGRRGPPGAAQALRSLPDADSRVGVGWHGADRHGWICRPDRSTAWWWWSLPVNASGIRCALPPPPASAMGTSSTSKGKPTWVDPSIPRGCSSCRLSSPHDMHATNLFR